MIVRALGFLAAGFFAVSAFADAGDAFDRALAQAKERHQPVLVDFHAPWCYSCYFMKAHVLNGTPWERAERETAVVGLDADSPEGARRMKTWGVKAMPTYLLFNSEGQELGRILGEQTRSDFYGWLFGLTARGSTFETLKAKAADGPDLAAAREVLGAYYARYDSKGGLDWYAGLPKPAQDAIAQDAKAFPWLGRLELQRAAAAKDAAGCIAVAPKVLAADLGCERPYEVDRIMACTEGQPGQRQVLLRPEASTLQGLVDRHVLSKKDRCADERSAVVTTADVYRTLGDSAAERQVLERAIEDVRKRIAGDLRRDRNLSDNLRVYLERAGLADELDALLPKLIDAYPEDYVYAYRYAKILATRGKHEQALKYFEQAATKAYGANQLRNAELRARSLQALNRTKEARTVLAEALKDNGPWFPEDATRLKAMLDSLPAA